MDDPEFEMESDEEAMLDLAMDRPEITGDLDTAPIVTVDQAQLSQKFLLRRKRMKVAVISMIIIFGLGAFASITYLVIHFLSVG